MTKLLMEEEKQQHHHRHQQHLQQQKQKPQLKQAWAELGQAQLPTGI